MNHHVMLLHLIVMDYFVLLVLIVLDQYLVLMHLLNFLPRFLLHLILLLMLMLILFFSLLINPPKRYTFNCLICVFVFAKLLFSNLLVPTVTSIKCLWVTVKLKKHLEFLRPNDIEYNYYRT